MLYHIWSTDKDSGKRMYWQAKDMAELVSTVEMLLWDKYRHNFDPKLTVSETDDSDVNWHNKRNRSDILSAIDLGVEMTQLSKRADALGYKLVAKT